jgi:hypothetical protein
MKYGIIVAALVASTWLNQTLQADFIIDRYTVAPALLQFGPGTTTRTTVNGSIFGGSRDESLTVRNQGGSEFFGILGFGVNGLSVDQAAFDEIYGAINYDSFSAIDFTQGGQYRLRLKYASSGSVVDMNNVVSITVTSGANSATVATSVPGSGSLPGVKFLDFNQFAGVDFTQVDSVKFGFDLAGYQGQDFGLASLMVTAIPEPSVAWLTLMTVAGLSMRRRRA